ncbi:MAG: AsmA family protein, partial [Fibrobacter sp.]|nr:AsmA family protein [Fibrobacter sp.]
MKKPLKIFLIILGSLILLYFILLLVAPKIARSYIEDHSKEMIGRSITIKDISLNPFTYVLDIDTLAIMEADDKTRFVGFDKFSININPLKLITRTLDISDIYMKALYVRVNQHGERFNFTDIQEYLDTKDSLYYVEHPDEKKPKDNTAKTAAEIAAGFPVKICLRNIAFEKGNIIYQDTKVGSKFHLKDFSINIPAIYLEDNKTGVDVSLKFADGGDLKVKVNANMATYDYSIFLDLNRFALTCIKPYLNDALSYKDLEGFLSADISIAGNINSILASNIKGAVSVDNLALTELSGKQIGAQNIQIGINKANLADNEYIIDSAVVDGLHSHIDLFKDGKTNFDVLLKTSNKDAENSAGDSTAVKTDEKPEVVTQDAPKPKAEPVPEPAPAADAKATEANAEAKVDSASATEESDKPAPSKPLKAKINKLLVKNSYITVTDHTIIRPF